MSVFPAVVSKDESVLAHASAFLRFKLSLIITMNSQFSLKDL